MLYADGSWRLRRFAARRWCRSLRIVWPWLVDIIQSWCLALFRDPIYLGWSFVEILTGILWRKPFFFFFSKRISRASRLHAVQRSRGQLIPMANGAVGVVSSPLPNWQKTALVVGAPVVLGLGYMYYRNASKPDRGSNKRSGKANGIRGDKQISTDGEDPFKTGTPEESEVSTGVTCNDMGFGIIFTGRVKGLAT